MNPVFFVGRFCVSHFPDFKKPYGVFNHRESGCRMCIAWFDQRNEAEQCAQHLQFAFSLGRATAAMNLSHEEHADEVGRAVAVCLGLASLARANHWPFPVRLELPEGVQDDIERLAAVAVEVMEVIGSHCSGSAVD